MIVSSLRTCDWPKLGKRKAMRAKVRLVLTPEFELSRGDAPDKAFQDIIDYAKTRLEHNCPSMDVRIESAGEKQVPAKVVSRLGSKTKALLLMGAERAGYDGALSYIEEQLTVGEAKQVGGFLNWVREDSANRCFGHGNLDQRFAQYLKESTK